VLKVFKSEVFMNKIEFVSHESFPEDQYTKELVYVCLEGKYRVAYVRKMTQNGGLFWSVPTVGATKSGKKEFYASFMQDSNFLEREIKDFLEGRSWEKGNSSGVSLHAKLNETPRSMDEVAEMQGLPF
jgi:hypothetical protein